MYDPTSPHPVLHRLRFRALASSLAAWFAVAGVLIVASCAHRLPPGASCAHRLPPGAVVVDRVPPDACVAFYGPGPCREHGTTVIGSTDAVAGPPPASWRGAVTSTETAR